MDFKNKSEWRHQKVIKTAKTQEAKTLERRGPQRCKVTILCALSFWGICWFLSYACMEWGAKKASIKSHCREDRSSISGHLCVCVCERDYDKHLRLSVESLKDRLHTKVKANQKKAISQKFWNTKSKTQINGNMPMFTDWKS